MKQKLDIKLPNLSKYRQSLVEQGAIVPLPIVPFSDIGLLSELPPPSSGKTGWPWTVETKPLPTVMPNGRPWPKISIVTPSYNQGQFIEETIRSVLLQNYPNLEYIICDSESTDGTKEILEKYSPWLSFCQSKKDRGQGHAINLGFSIASGAYYGWINSDDYYLPSCLLNIVNKLVTSNKDFIYGDAIELNEVAESINYWHSYYVLDRYLIIGGIIASHSAFWKSSIHVPIWEELNCAIDYELWLRMIPDKSKVNIKKPLALCRIQDQSKSVNPYYKHLWDQDYKKIFRVYDINKNRLQWHSREMKLLNKFYQYFSRKVDSSYIEGIYPFNINALTIWRSDGARV